MEPTSELNDRQEQFCQEYVHRPVGKWAAAKAGYEPQNAASQACRLLARPDIRARITTLRREVARQHCRDADAILANLQSVFELSLIEQQYHVAVRIMTLQARITGLLPGQGRVDASVTEAREAIAEAAPMPIDANPGQPEGNPTDEAGNDAAPEPPAPPQELSHDGGCGAQRAEKPTDANPCQTPDESSDKGEASVTDRPQDALSDVAVGAPSLPIEANPCQSVAMNSAPEPGTAAQWPSGRRRRTFSGRRK